MTLLARALAGEAGVRFLSVAGSDFVEMSVGVGNSRISRGSACGLTFISFHEQHVDSGQYSHQVLSTAN